MPPVSRGFLLLRRTYLTPPCQWQCLRERAPVAMALPFPRHASNRSSKPKVLEKPTKFNPPSHPSRLIKQQMPRHYGPQMTEQRVLEFDRTEFPHMLPPRGTWKHWFLTSRLFHTWFALWVLMALVAFAYYEHWTRSTIFRENLPDRWTVLLHPMQATQEFIIAYRMSSRIGDGYTASVRKHGVDDCQKRASYRKAHGGGDDQGMQWWPEFERKYGQMVVDKNTGRLTDDQEVKKEYEGEVFWKVVKLYNKWMNN